LSSNESEAVKNNKFIFYIKFFPLKPLRKTIDTNFIAYIIIIGEEQHAYKWLDITSK
jgi:hypothetical protein